MKFCLSLITILSFLFSTAAFPCSTVSLPKSNMKLVAKSYDWHEGHGMVVINKRNVQKRALLQTGPGALVWQSKYASASFVQFGRGFPVSGMNEKGLVVEIMWLAEAAYPRNPDPTRSINEIQWIQYLLDTAGDLTEALEQAKKVDIVGIAAPVHYLVCDANADCGTFEYLDGKLVIHSGAAITAPVLTNDTYERSAAYLKGYRGFGGNRAIPHDKSSLSRFVRAAHLSQQIPQGSFAQLKHAFEILNSVTTFGYSKWNIVYDTKNKRVAFKTVSNSKMKMFDLTQFDPSCKTDVKVLEMNADYQNIGVNAEFETYTEKKNRANVAQTKFLPDPKMKDILAIYPDILTSCQE